MNDKQEVVLMLLVSALFGFVVVGGLSDRIKRHTAKPPKFSDYVRDEWR